MLAAESIICVVTKFVNILRSQFIFTVQGLYGQKAVLLETLSEEQWVVTLYVYTGILHYIIIVNIIISFTWWWRMIRDHLEWFVLQIKRFIESLTV